MADLPSPDLASLPPLVQQYVDGASLRELAKAYGVRAHRTIYQWLLRETGAAHEEIVTQMLVNRIADADENLEESADKISVARARAIAQFARMDFERRRPKLYGPKQEVSHDMQVTVVLNKPVTPYIDPRKAPIMVNSQVIENTSNSSDEK